MVEEEQQRPDPDSLLALANEKPRGRLKVFFGACAGVGKTYAMLQEAQRLRAQGLDVLVGVVETHGRSETAALLDGLALLPQKRIQHRGRLVQEFDLDAALARHPALILMDELAHSSGVNNRSATASTVSDMSNTSGPMRCKNGCCSISSRGPTVMSEAL